MEGPGVYSDIFIVHGTFIAAWCVALVIRKKQDPSYASLRHRMRAGTKGEEPHEHSFQTAAGRVRVRANEPIGL
jgi:hypothetical protein